MRLIQLPVFTYDELPEKVQSKIINDAITFMVETFDGSAASCSDVFYKAVMTAEKMQTPWFTHEYVWEYCKEEVLEICRDVEYFNDGRVYQEHK